jgi:hypothetical protein
MNGLIKAAELCDILDISLTVIKTAMIDQDYTKIPKPDKVVECSSNTYRGWKKSTINKFIKRIDFDVKEAKKLRGEGMLINDIAKEMNVHKCWIIKKMDRKRAKQWGTEVLDGKLVDQYNLAFQCLNKLVRKC